MTAIDDKSVVLIKSVDSSNKGFGTGFIIHKDAENTYVLTCAHVIKELKSEANPNKVLVENYTGKVHLSGARDNIDLAVIKIENERLKGSRLKLMPKGQEGVPFNSLGWVAYISGSQEIESFEGKLTSSTQFSGKEKEQRIKAWKIKIVRKVDEKSKLKEGCSGAPIVDTQGGFVIGVITSMELPEGIKGRAIEIGELLNLWPEIPEPLSSELSPYQNPIDIDPKVSPEIIGPSEFEFKGEVYAFLVGIDKYRHGVNVQEDSVKLESHQIVNLKFCKNDVLELNKFLLDHKVKPENIIALYENKDTERANILKNFEEFAKSVGKNNNDPLVLIYFACHGYPYRDENYLIPYDGDRSNLKYSSISYQDFQFCLKKIETSRLIVFLDSCHSGEWTESNRRGIAEYNPLKSLENSDHYHIITSCKANQSSQEVNGHGIFTKALLNLLKNSYSEIYDANITTVNLIDPLVNSVKQITHDEQEPSFNFKELKEGILIGQNLKRSTEFKDVKKKQKDKNLKYFQLIDPIIKNKNPKLYDEIYDCLELYIEWERIHNKYKKFYESFDLYVNLYYQEEHDDETIEYRVDGLILRYNKCQEQRTGTTKPEKIGSESKEYPEKEKLTQDFSIIDTTSSVGKKEKSVSDGLSVVITEERKFELAQQESILIFLFEYSSYWFRMSDLLDKPVSRLILLKKVQEIRNELNQKIKNGNENEEEAKKAQKILGCLDRTMERFDEEWKKAIIIKKKEKRDRKDIINKPYQVRRWEI